MTRRQTNKRQNKKTTKKINKTKIWLLEKTEKITALYPDWSMGRGLNRSSYKDERTALPTPQKSEEV